MSNTNTVIEFDVTEKGGGAVPRIKITPMRRRVVMACLMLITVCCALDETMMATALASVNTGLSGTDSHFHWLVNGYLITYAGSQLVYGQFATALGRLPLCIFSILCYVVGSLGFSLVRDVTLAIMFRSLVGLGASGLTTMPFILVSDIIPFRSRGTYFGYLGSTYALANILGPLIGGFIDKSLGWRYLSGFSLLLGGVTLILTLVALPKATRQIDAAAAAGGGPGAKLNRARLDVWGSLTLMVLIMMFNLALNSLLDSGLSVASDSYTFFIPLALSVAACPAFWLIERRAALPIIPFRLLNRRVFLMGLLNVITGVPFFIFLYSWPAYNSEIRALPALEAGLSLIPLLVGMAVGSLAGGMAIDRFNNYPHVIKLGFLSVLLGSGLMLRLSLGVKLVEEMIYTSLIGLGTGINLQATLIGLQAIVDVVDWPLISSLSAFLFSLGGLIGTFVQPVTVKLYLMAVYPENPTLSVDETTTAGERLILSAGNKIGFVIIAPIMILGLLLALFVTNHHHHSRPVAERCCFPAREDDDVSIENQEFKEKVNFKTVTTSV